MTMVEYLTSTKVGSFILALIGAVIGALAAAMGLAYRRGSKDADLEASVARAREQSCKNEKRISELDHRMAGQGVDIAVIRDRSEQTAGAIEEIRSDIKTLIRASR